MDIKFAEQLKDRVPFNLLDLMEKGQLTLLQISDRYGAMLFAYGPELIVVRNSELNQVLKTGTLPANQPSNASNQAPIIFLKVEGDLLFLQHQGDDYLVIADLPSVLNDAKAALDDAKMVKMDLDGVDIRQISVAKAGGHNLATVVTRNKDNVHKLHLVDHQRAAMVKSMTGVTSAVFSPNSNFIIAGKDAQDENLLVLDLQLKQVNALKFSFCELHEDIEID